MTAVVPEQDVEQFLFEDAEFDVACDIISLKANGYYPDCLGEPARWVAWRPRRCCGKGPRFRLLCDRCKRAYQRLVAWNAFIICSECHQETGGFASFTPLKGKL